jgi:hypothetical protein
MTTMKVWKPKVGATAGPRHRRGVGSQAPDPCGDARPIKEIAAKIREMTAGGCHTPSEILQREGRDER